MDSRTDIPGLVASLTLEEKASLCSGLDFWHLKGVERLGIPSIMATDGPHGLRKQTGTSDHVGLNASVPATCFPPAVAMASSWDPVLLREVGAALGEECLQEGVGIILGPGVNIKRSPLGGRNFEYFSEDPWLAGQLAAALIDGVQSQGVGTSLKHFAVNNQESHRMVVDAVVDERTLREIYLPAFEIAVRQAQPWTVMCSYNRLNGTYLSDHRPMLTAILKEEWGHTGLVVSDWGATNDRVAGIRAGMELEMPASAGANDARIVAAVRGGQLDPAELDRAVTRILTVIQRAVAGQRPGFRYDASAHHLLARRVAEESMVLLKNEGGLLPLEPRGRVALIGAFATDSRYQGAGSSQIVPTCLDHAHDAIRDLLAGGGSLVHAPGYRLDSELPDAGLEAAALALLDGAASVIVMAGLPAIFESEGFDRDHMRLPANQLALLDHVLARRPDAVIVLQNGSPVELPFAGRARAIVESYLGGQAGGGALARVLFGLAVPGGKLAESFPQHLEDNSSWPWFPGQPRQVQYREGIWVGYRYLERAAVAPAFPFGHGLGYTSFGYADLRMEGVAAGRATDCASLGEFAGLRVSCTVTNTGPRAGWEIAQLYVADCESTVHRPLKELKGFAKLWLEPGASAAAVFDLGWRAFAFWDSGSHAWAVEAGAFRLLVGASSADIRLEAGLDLTGLGRVTPPPAGVEPYRELPGGRAAIDDRAFTALLGHPVPAVEALRPFHRNSTIGELGQTLVGRLVHAQIRKSFLGTMAAGADPVVLKMMERMVSELPLRSLVQLSAGQFTDAAAEGLLLILNGHPLRGMRRLLRG